MSVSSTAVPARPPRRWKRRLLRLGGWFLFCYAVVILVLMALENWFLFHPSTADQDWQEPPPAIHAEDVDLTSADGTHIHAWWCPPDDWQPAQGALLYSHGNALNLSYRSEGVRRWQYLKQAVLIFDYPGYGKSGGKPSEAGCYAAADAAYDWLIDKKKVPAQRILLYGGSLGGGVAVDVASRRPHRAVVLVSAFTSIPDMAQKQFPFLPARWLVRNRFDNLSKIARCNGPVFIAHGTADSLVPFTQGERLFAAAPEPKCFFPMEGQDHNHTPPPEFYSRVQQFLTEVEKGTP